MSLNLAIRKTTIEDTAEIYTLYKDVANIDGGIIRKDTEVSHEYIEGFVQKSIMNGLALVAVIDNQIVAEIHAYTPDIYAFQHLLTDLTIVVHQDQQGKGIGKLLFERFLNEVQNHYKYILRVELFVREGNTKNVNFYKKLGFENEGRQDRKIFKATNSFDTPLHMVWFNPEYGQ
jgi:ribosomal protein S18 acetylase RimI-like enzyme